MASEEISERVTEFIRDKFLNGDPQGELDESTPLLELGVLNSLNTVRLVSFVRDEMSVAIPPIEINGKNFKNIRSITALILGLVNA